MNLGCGKENQCTVLRGVFARYEVPGILLRARRILKFDEKPRDMFCARSLVCF